MALAARLQGQDFRTWVMIGDGDSQEGQIWEAAFVAARYGLDSLTAILDWNGLQQYGWATEKGYGELDRLAAQENPLSRWRAFGWNAIETDGHDFHAIFSAFAAAKAHRGQPTVIVARTVKGKGISYMETTSTGTPSR